ncbi:MAG: hypothetical protein ACI8PZ_002329 [Myxococcota bacterium]|jgi:hypothetical protein
MSVLTVTRKIASPVADVWSVLDDFGGVHRFGAGIESSPIINGSPSRGVGAERACALYDGNYINERVTASVENRRLSIEVFDTSMPIKRADATFAIAPVAGGGTTVTMTMDYVVKYGPMGLAMDVLMMRGMMKKNLDNLLAGLEQHLLSGETVGQGWTPEAVVA